MPFSIHSLKKSTRRIMSSNQELRGFRLGYPMPPLIQMFGTWLFSSELNMSSSSPVMTMMPLTAFCNVTSVLAIWFSKPLKRPYSCVKHVPSEIISWVSSTMAKLEGCAFSLVRRDGRRDSCSWASSVTVSSELLPPPPPPSRGWIERTTFKTFSDSWIMYAMFALLCMPKTSGSSESGKAFTKSRQSSTDIVSLVVGHL
mmetsp:Transcript_96452/g.256281  ORF Transcript_96452/g.256281 Transcript_96452/m.256281 type:complete len:200 (-) Transcript_96452:1451-2050(-)